MPPPTDDTALRRLADHVKRRRVGLGMNKIDVAKAADITINTYMKIEDGKPLRDLTYGKVEAALDWAAGSCQEVLRGGEPTPIQGLEEGVATSPVTDSDLEGDVGQAVTNALIGVADDMSAADIRALKQRVIDEWRELRRNRRGSSGGN
ncbi:hypothetical protein AB0G60_03125 [Streptomyces angustmyceticus]|nr:hypothetical protein [Streptomyces angustmyceticus]UAL65653.1 hypothetical protein K7396_03085 [Streptomyces angustmyceticus]